MEKIIAKYKEEIEEIMNRLSFVTWDRFTASEADGFISVLFGWYLTFQNAYLKKHYCSPEIEQAWSDIQEANRERQWTGE